MTLTNKGEEEHQTTNIKDGCLARNSYLRNSKLYAEAC